MRRISASYIFPLVAKPIKYGIITIDSNGTIVEVFDTRGELKEYPMLEFYNGVIVPFFHATDQNLEFEKFKIQALALSHSDFQIFITEKIHHHFPPNSRNQKGLIATGANPGLNLIDPFDFERMSVLPESRIRSLIG